MSDYLWDPTAPPDENVADTERMLAPLQFAHRQRPLVLPARGTAPRVNRWKRTTFAIAASLLVMGTATAALWWWRQSWPAGRAWPVSAASGQADAALAVDRPLLLSTRASAEVSIARIGAMRVEPGSSITLTETRSTRHRVSLDRGAVSVRVWAPPARFAIQTPAGNVIDLGCVFDLRVDAAGVTRLAVKTGWVQLENPWGETLVPAGASAVMSASTRPSVPVYDDADRRFKARVAEFERAVDDPARLEALPELTDVARRRDVLTLLLLVHQYQSGTEIKRALLTRAAALFPPPADVTIDQILAERSRMWVWYDALDLPPAKNWWLNWRDAFPRPWRQPVNVGS